MFNKKKIYWDQIYCGSGWNPWEKRNLESIFCSGHSWWPAEPSSSTSPMRIQPVWPVCPSLCLVDKYHVAEAAHTVCLQRLLWFGTTGRADGDTCPLNYMKGIIEMDVPLTLPLPHVPSFCSLLDRYKPGWDEFKSSLQGKSSGWMSTVDPEAWGCISAELECSKANLSHQLSPSLLKGSHLSWLALLHPWTKVEQLQHDSRVKLQSPMARHSWVDLVV